MYMCAWMAGALVSLPATWTSIRIDQLGLSFSEERKYCRRSSNELKNFSGQWQFWHVCSAGRRSCTGDGIGLGNVLPIVLKICRTPESFERTYQSAPGPMWHSTHLIRACGDWVYRVYSGFMTVWQVVPQNCTDSV